MARCRKCNGNKGTPEEGKLTCEPCLAYQREQMRQYHVRKKAGTVGKVGRPTASVHISIDNPVNTNFDAFSTIPVTNNLIDQKVFLAGCIVLEKYIPSRVAEPLLHELLDAMLDRAGGVIKRVGPG